ncbi:HXXEE domain-containing protein [Vallitalea sediminicola]
MNELSCIIWVFPLTITLHNIEEALWLPSWSQKVKRYQKPVGKNEFYFALICVTLLAYLFSFIYLFYGNEGIIRYVYFGFVGAMILNAIFPHLIATIVLRKYAPGVITGVLLNVPCYSLLISLAVKSNVISLTEVLISTVIVGGIILAILPILFRIGRKVVDY